MSDIKSDSHQYSIKREPKFKNVVCVMNIFTPRRLSRRVNNVNPILKNTILIGKKPAATARIIDGASNSE